MNKNTAMAHELPYWQFESNPIPHLVLWDGSVSSAFEITPLDIECFDESRVNQITFGLRSFLNSLPDRVYAQFFVKVESNFSDTIERHESLITTDNELLLKIDAVRVEQIVRHVEEGKIFQPKMYFSLRTESSFLTSSFSLSSASKFSSAVATEYGERLQTLSQSLESAKAMLEGLGFRVSDLTKVRLIEITYEHLNPKRANEVGVPIVSPTVEIAGSSTREQVVFGDLIMNQEDFILDRMRTRVITLKTLPELTVAGMMNGFLSFQFKYELFLSIKVPEQTKEIKSLEQKRRMAHSLASSSTNKVSDLESESRLSQTTDLLREIIETGQKIFQAELTIILREDCTASGLRALSLKTREVLAKFKTLSGSEGLQETVGSWKVFKNNLPLAPLDLVRAKRMKTNNLVDFLPLYGANFGDSSPVVLLKTRSGSLFSYDPYSQAIGNYNCLVTGTSGSGKSFANNFLMLQQIARGTQVFIIDIGGSYKKLTKALGGQYFEINLSAKIAINPFALKDPSKPPSSERLKAFVNIVEQMVVDQDDRLSRFERVQLEQALSIIFEQNRNLETPRAPIISDLVSYCASSGEPSLQKIAKLLFPWTGDMPFGQLLDRQGFIQTNSPVVAFDLKGLQDADLQSVIILILTNFILEQVEENRDLPKRVLVDEAWALLKGPAVAFMEYAARTFRKTGSGITFITQGVDDVVSSGIGSAIINNTATKLIMLQRGDTTILKDVLKLNSQELKLIGSLEQRKGMYSEGFLMAGESRQVIRIEPSPLEYWISTSDAHDNRYFSNLIAGGHSFESALVYAAEKAPFGIGKSVDLAAA